jgi:hypothetical protein
MNRAIVVPRHLATVDARPTSRPLQHGRGATEVLEFRRMAERAQESAPRSPLLPERQRFKEPVRAPRPEDVEVERENRECNRPIH